MTDLITPHERVVTGRVPTTDPRVRRAIDLVWHEADLLDRREYHQWEALWTDDGRYVVPIDTETRDFDDCLNMVYDDARMRSLRVVRMTEGHALAVVDSARTCRTVSRFVAEAVDDASVTLRSSQVVVAYKRGHHDLWAGEVEHEVVLGSVPERDRIRLKVVRLVDAHDAVPAAGFLL